MRFASDPSTELLLHHLRESAYSSRRQLWLADENQSDAIPLLSPFRESLTVLSNRFDLTSTATKEGITSQFSDWKLSATAPFNDVYLRICKEKPINVHLLQLAYDHLTQGGKLILSGEKGEGIKTIAKYAEELFRQNLTPKKHGSAYLAIFEKSGSPSESESMHNLVDYHQIRPIGEWRNLNLLSKPGVYGWDKIDRGSEMLIDTALDLLRMEPQKTDSILDLGCGYGLISLACGALPSHRRVATDNNAAALICTEANARAHNLNIEVIAGDCGDTAPGKFDLILCNPPFHKGFDVDTDLTRRFILAAAQKSHQQSLVFFVVNSFIAIENKIHGAFRTQKTLANNGRFKVVGLTL